MKLDFVKDRYGPYAEKLNFVLQCIEGHFIRGYGDRSGNAQIYLLPSAKDAADKFLDGNDEAKARLVHVQRLIDGFETPYGVELLSTVHWIAKSNGKAALDVDEVTKTVREWSSRKGQLFRSRHVRAALNRLQSVGFLKAW